jgi:flagellar basal body-associated protein FliL
MRKIIIIVLVLLLVGGGGAVGLVMLGIVRNPLKPPPPAELDAVAKAAAEADAKAKANAFQAPLAAFTIVKVGDLVVPVLTTDGKNRKVFVTARLIIDTPAKKAVQEDMPKLVDALLSDFIPYFQKFFVDHELVDIAVIKKKVTRHAKEVFGDKVKDVLLVNVFSAGGDPPFKGAPYDPD